MYLFWTQHWCLRNLRDLSQNTQLETDFDKLCWPKPSFKGIRQNSQDDAKDLPIVKFFEENEIAKFLNLIGNILKILILKSTDNCRS